MKTDQHQQLDQEAFELIFSILKNNQILLQLTPEMKSNPGFADAFAALNQQLTAMLASFELNPNKAAAIQAFTLLLYEFIAQQQKVLKLRGTALETLAARKRKQRLMSLAAIEYFLQKRLNEEEEQSQKPDFKKQFLELNENISDLLISVFQIFDTLILLVPELRANARHQERLNQIHEDFISSEQKMNTLLALKDYSKATKELLQKITLKPVADFAQKLAEHRASKQQPKRGLRP